MNRTVTVDTFLSRPSVPNASPQGRNALGTVLATTRLETFHELRLALR